MDREVKQGNRRGWQTLSCCALATLCKLHPGAFSPRYGSIWPAWDIPSSLMSGEFSSVQLWYISVCPAARRILWRASPEQFQSLKFQYSSSRGKGKLYLLFARSGIWYLQLALRQSLKDVVMPTESHIKVSHCILRNRNGCAEPKTFKTIKFKI